MGRGVFSYHLVDGLFGLADKNGDAAVSLSELDRYLEDHVSAEAAPQSQTPMVLGNKAELLAAVNPAILADLKNAKAGGLPVFAATEGRGLEDEVLAKLDSSIRQKYFAFKLALKEKRFFLPVGNCAEDFYASLSTEPGLAPLQGFLKRNYAAALQDDAQQTLNEWLKTNRSREAGQNFLKAIELNPDYAPAMLGMAYLSALSAEALAKADLSAVDSF